MHVNLHVHLRWKCNSCVTCCFVLCLSNYDFCMQHACNHALFIATSILSGVRVPPRVKYTNSFVHKHSCQYIAFALNRTHVFLCVLFITPANSIARFHKRYCIQAYRSRQCLNSFNEKHEINEEIATYLVSRIIDYYLCLIQL